MCDQKVSSSLNVLKCVELAISDVIFMFAEGIVSSESLFVLRLLQL